MGLLPSKDESGETPKIVATDVMVGKTRRVTKSGIADAPNQIAGFLIVEAADIIAAALFQDHPHIIVFPGVFLILFGLSWNLVGDALRDILDPKLRGRR